MRATAHTPVLNGCIVAIAMGFLYSSRSQWLTRHGFPNYRWSQL
jgi:hypothetical protein